ncbi:MAG: asparagine synthase (glutamine-hydrolyzing) [Verrucomicrobiae bacterium]|nr:asparagine synthase (glutamine-hydrolyzing) [Verrucomicrobiae bacterium]
MCGIVGIWRMPSATGGTPLDPRLLDRMRDAMLHRGPDAGGSWISPEGAVGLAHRRLSIVDLSEAAGQPMANEDGSVRITYNGEIYNHATLRLDLERLGHRYRSRSDTETILHAYEEWGPACLARLHGMFAFAVWDAPRRRLWLARDRMGKKPLYFAKLGRDFVFASEIKALLLHPEARKTVCEEALWHQTSFAAAPAPLTLFEGVFKLPPSCHLTIEENGVWSFVEYWRPWQPTDHPAKDMEDYAADVRRVLKTSVERRLMSDVPFGVFLSGGVDSSANVALMSRARERPVDTFSVGFEDRAQAPHDEIHHARRVAALFKTNHHEVLVNDRSFLDFADELPWHQDEPLADPVCFPLHAVAKLARQNGTIVVQVGEGSDEIFAGYDIYQNYLRRARTYWRHFQAAPRWMQKSAAHLARSLLGARTATHVSRAAGGEPVFLSAALGFYDGEKHGLRAWPHLPPSSNLSAAAYEGENPAFAMLRRNFPEARVESLPRLEDGPHPEFLKKMIHWECRQRLGELLLMRLDKMTMAASVEGRAPFLDTELVELAMRIPSALKIAGGIGKAVLKKAVEPLLPHDLVYRRKVGFCGGSGNMLTPRILDFAEERIRADLLPRGWRRRALERLFADHRSHRGEFSFQIWTLMNLALWYRRWTPA